MYIDKCFDLMILRRDSESLAAQIFGGSGTLTEARGKYARNNGGPETPSARDAAYFFLPSFLEISSTILGRKSASTLSTRLAISGVSESATVS